jgi:hypothetical protein
MRQGYLLALAVSAVAGAASAQTTGDAAGLPSHPPSSRPAWSFEISATAYVVPDDPNYVQPMVTADRSALHLEARYNYEDRRSVSGFIGWTLETGDRVKLGVTPMIGVVVGRTDGIVPALNLALTWGRLEVYSEGEYVVEADRSESFLYDWSEVSVRATDWLRIGVSSQLTRARNMPSEIQRGIFAGLTTGRFEGALYLFNPGSDDAYVVGSVSVAF